MIEIIIISVALFLSVFCSYNTESNELVWWDTHIPSLTMIALSLSYLFKLHSLCYQKKQVFKSLMFVVAVIGILSIVFASKVNSSIYAMYVTLSVPAITYFFDTNNNYIKIIVITALFLCASAVINVSSRTGILSITISLLYIIYKVFKSRINIILLLGLLSINILISILLFAKKDSTEGRCFILNNTIEMILDKPLGWGTEGFEANYMLYQADYFAKNKDEKAEMLASNIKHPLNEYLYITVNYGVPVLLFILFTIYILLKYLYKEKSKESRCIIHFIVLFLLWCLFSYPCSISFVLIMILAFISYTLKIEQLLNRSKLLRFISIFLIFIYAGTEVSAFNDERKWDKAIHNYQQGNMEAAMAVFDNFANYSIDKGSMLYSLATIEYNNKNYAKCIEICNECNNYSANYNIEFILANCYYFMGEYKRALEHLVTAHNMCPNRFVPLYKQFMIYNDICDTVNLKKTGNIIISKKIKIPSRKIDIMKNNVKYILMKTK